MSGSKANKLRILHVIPSLQKGGAERLCVDICRRLSEVGHDARIVIFHPINEFESFTKGIDITVLPSNSSLSMFRGIKEFPERLQQYINEFKPHVIHSHLFEAEMASRACTFRKAAWFSHCHSNSPNFSATILKNGIGRQNLINVYEKHWLRNRYKANGGNTFLAISNNTREYFTAHLPSKFKIHQLANAIDYEVFRAKAGKPCDLKQLKLISVGGVNKNKNHVFLLSVLNDLVNQQYDASLSIVGDGPELSKLKGEADSLGLSSRVSFKGKVDDVAAELSKSKIYVHAAKSEALGLTLIEAMACGLPVVTLDGGGNRDLIQEGKNGYLIAQGDLNAFIQAIISIHESQEHCMEISDYARKFAASYDIKEYCERLVDFYLEKTEE